MFGIWHFTIFTTVTFNGSQSGQTSIPLCLSGRGWDYDATGSAGKHCWRGLTNWPWAASFLSRSVVSRARFKGRILNVYIISKKNNPKTKHFVNGFTLLTLTALREHVARPWKPPTWRQSTPLTLRCWKTPVLCPVLFFCRLVGDLFFWNKIRWETSARGRATWPWNT